MSGEDLVVPGISDGVHVAPLVPRQPLRIVSECRCSRRHRSASTFARCAWPGAAVSGSGQLAIDFDPEPAA